MNLTVIDCGGTFIKFALMNERAEFISRGKIKSSIRSREEFISTIAKIYESMPESEGISISLPGVIDSINGKCLISNAYPFNNDFEIVNALKERFSVEVVIENDARCATIAEMMIGSLSDVNSGMVIVFGTSIGSSYFLNRKIYRGENLSAGEIVFLITDEGSFDNFSTRGLCKRYSESISGEDFFYAVNSNDEKAIKILNEVTKRIAIEIFNIQRILDLNRIAIGGGISEQKIFIDSIRSHLEDLHRDIKLPSIEIVTCKFNNDSNLIGALEWFLMMNRS